MRRPSIFRRARKLQIRSDLRPTPWLRERDSNPRYGFPQPKTAFPLKKRIVCRPKSLPKLWTSCRRPPDSPRVPCEPVSVCNRTGLRPAEREIEKWQPETGAQNPPRTDRNTENYRPETGICPRNTRECRRFSPTGAGGIEPPHGGIKIRVFLTTHNGLHV